MGDSVQTLRPLLKVRRGVGTQCRDTQELYLKMGGEVGPQWTETQDLYLKVRGEVEHSVQAHRSDSSLMEPLPSMIQETQDLE